MPVTKENYRGIYERFISSGFDVIDARQYYNQTDNMKPEVEQLIRTPWTMDRLQVFCYAAADIDLVYERANGHRRILSHEFWIFDPKTGAPVNLDQIHPEGYALYDPYNRISREEAYETADEFAMAASYQPHVFMAAEFAEVRNYLNARMELPPVTKNDYLSYLKHMEGEIQNGSNSFTGKIRSIADMHIAYQTAEEFDQFE